MLTAMTYSIKTTATSMTPKIPNFVVSHPIVQYIFQSPLRPVFGAKGKPWRFYVVAVLLVVPGYYMYIVIILTTPSVPQLDFSEEHKSACSSSLRKKNNQSFNHSLLR